MIQQNNQRTQHSAQKTDSELQQIIKHLCVLFDRATDGHRRDTNSPENMKQMQEDFSYIVDDIMRGPRYMAQKAINNANVYINEVPRIQP